MTTNKQLKRSFFRDILRDINMKKYSMTKFVVLNTQILLIIAVISGVCVMIKNDTVDHILIGELIALLLTLLGYKNVKRRGTENNDKSVAELTSNKETDNTNEDEKDDVG